MFYFPQPSDSADCLMPEGSCTSGSLHVPTEAVLYFMQDLGLIVFIVLIARYVCYTKSDLSSFESQFSSRTFLIYIIFIFHL